MKSVLMHEDIPVAEIILINNRPHHFCEIYKKDELPVGVYSDNPEISSRLLLSWYKSRAIPHERPRMDKLFDKLGKTAAEAFILSSGISLTDTFWIKEEDSPIKWSDVNFHENGFSETLAKLYLKGDGSFLPSPDFTTDGCLEKFWIMSGNVPCLVKMDQTFSGIQCANEVVASRIASLLDIDAVPYTHCDINGIHGCICPCFIKDPHSDFVNALQLKYSYIGQNVQLEDILLKNKDIQKELLLDILLGNEDRHERNLGFIGEKTAPVFDTGSCLGYSGIIGRFLKFPPISRELAANRVAGFSLLDEIPDLSYVIDEVYEQYEICNDSRRLARLCFESGRDMLNRAIEKAKNVQELERDVQELE